MRNDETGGEVEIDNVAGELLANTNNDAWADVPARFNADNKSEMEVGFKTIKSFIVEHCNFLSNRLLLAVFEDKL